MEKENQQQTGSVIVKDVLVARPANEEGNIWFLTVGKHKASEKVFDSRVEAIAYADTPKWDTVIAVVAEMIEIHDEENKKRLKNETEYR